MPSLSLAKLWAEDLLYDETKRVKKLVNIQDKVTWHFAVFQFLRSPYSRLLDSSYGTEPLCGIAGTPYSGQSPSRLHSWFIEQVHKQSCQVGGKSAWQVTMDEKPTELIVIIEIIDKDNNLCHQEIQQTLNKWKTQVQSEKLPDYGPLDALLDGEEINHLVSIMIEHHWNASDFKCKVDLLNTYQNIYIRRVVNKAFGLQALRDLARFLDGQKNQQNWHRIPSDEDGHTSWICCKCKLSHSRLNFVCLGNCELHRRCGCCQPYQEKTRKERIYLSSQFRKESAESRR